MSSNINVLVPSSTAPTTQSVRDNFSSAKSEIEALQSAVDAKAAAGGSTAQAFAASNLTVAGSMMPTVTNTQDIGSPSLRWNNIYVNEAHLSVNTLYLGDTPVLGTNQNTVEVKADPDQSILIKTTGLGTSSITSQHGIQMTTSGTNADIVAQATGTGAKVRFSADNSVELTGNTINFTSSSVTTTGNHAVTGNLTVTGNVTVNGTNSIINSTTVTTKDNIIVLNSGELGSGVTSGLAGIQVDRGVLTDYQLVFDESDDMFKVGQIGSLQTVASQAWANSTFATTTHTTDTAVHLTSAQNTLLDAITVTAAEINQAASVIGSAALTTSAVTSNQVLDTVSAAAVRTVKYVIQVTSGAAYQACELLVIHDGSTTASVEYSNVVTGSALATFDTDISGGNLRLLVTPVNAATAFKVLRTTIAV